MKTKFFVLALSLTSISFAEAASRNLCDDLIDSKASPEYIAKCLDSKDPRFGRSEYYIEHQQQQEVEQEDAKKEKAEKEEKDASAEKLKKEKMELEEKRKQNLEEKIFTSDELFEAGFGKPFFAIKNGKDFKDKTITTGDALCSYLGYEKAKGSTLSPLFWEDKKTGNKVEKVNMQGLVIDTYILGGASKTPEIYKEDPSDRYAIRKYVDITCVKRKDKAVDKTGEALKMIKLVPNILPDSPKENSNTQIDNSSRSTKTPYGYDPKQSPYSGIVTPQ